MRLFANPPSPLPAILALALLPSACTPDTPPLATPQPRDSAGVRIVENPRPPEGSRLGWQIGPEPTLTIGAADGEAPYVFRRLEAAITLADGAVVAADRISNEVRKFDAGGAHVASWGGFGTGPGEFDELYAVARWRGDSIAAWDHFPYRGVSIFDAEGNLGRVVALGMGQPDRNIGILRGGAFLADHWLREGEGSGVLPRESELLTQEQVFEIRDAEGARLASLAPFVGREYFEYRSWKAPASANTAFTRTVHAAAWGDLAVVSRNHAYEIHAYATDGTLRRIVRVDHAPVPVTESLVELAREESRWGHLFDRMPHPETLPAFGAVMSDALDHLWVREYPVPGRPGLRRLWTVFDPEGRALGFVETPEGLWIEEIGAEHVLARAVGEGGEAQVQVWPLRRRAR